MEEIRVFHNYFTVNDSLKEGFCPVCLGGIRQVPFPVAEKRKNSIKKLWIPVICNEKILNRLLKKIMVDGGYTGEKFAEAVKANVINFSQLPCRRAVPPLRASTLS